ESIGDMQLPLSLRAPYSPDDPLEQAGALKTIADTLMSAAVIGSRNGVLAALRQGALAAPADPDLSVLASQVTNVFQAPPVLARLGETLASAPTKAASMSTSRLGSPKAAPRP